MIEFCPKCSRIYNSNLGCKRYECSKTLDQRFMSRVVKTGSCWLWSGTKQDSTPRLRYGKFYLGRGRYIKAHRYSWEMKNGEIPKGYFICHHCDNPTCVNPEHLFCGTNADNMRDMNTKKRGRFVHGEKQGSSKLTENSVEKIRQMYTKRGEWSCYSLARKFGVNPATISKIVLGKSWVHSIRTAR